LQWLPDRPLILWSARPKRYDPSQPIHIVVLGDQSSDDRDGWLGLVGEADILVIALEFPEVQYPEIGWFNFGNLFDEQYQPKPREQSTYGTTGRLFADLRRAGSTSRGHYGLSRIPLEASSCITPWCADTAKTS
jgi:hypothetical protein